MNIFLIIFIMVSTGMNLIWACTWSKNNWLDLLIKVQFWILTFFGVFIIFKFM